MFLKQKKTKMKQKKKVQPTYEIEKVLFDDKIVNDQGVTLVRVKWVGFDEETYEPIENVVIPNKNSKKRPLKNTDVKKAPPVADALVVPSKQPPAKKRKVTTIDYMQHSLMSVAPEDAATNAESKTDTCSALSSATNQLLNALPTTTRRNNVSRARRDNISIEEQLNRSAEMRDLITQDVTTTTPVPDKATEHLYYSGTDSDAPIKSSVACTKPAIVQTIVKPVIPSTPILFPYCKQNKKQIVEKKPEQISDSDQKDTTLSAMSRHHDSVNSKISVAMREENWAENSALENANDDGKQPIRGAHVCHSTVSTAMEERNYKAYGINSFFRDTQFADDVELERKLFGVAVRNLCRANKEDENNSDALARAKQQIENAGFGKALVSVHSLCASAKSRKKQDAVNLTSSKFDYPLQTDVRCFYDHHRFTNIPIFIPLAFSNGEREMVSILSSICFCSFSCAKSWIKQMAPSAFRSDNSDIMLTVFARKYFGITESIKSAEPLIMHEDYGGPLNTRQWRAMGTTHHSILRQPLCVAAPSTIVAEVYVRSRKDAGKVAKIAKRTEETHFSAIPERPERNSADAAEASKRKLKEGDGRPLKLLQTVDSEGNRITMGDDFIDAKVARGTALRNAKLATEPVGAAKVARVVSGAVDTKAKSKKKV